MLSIPRQQLINRSLASRLHSIHNGKGRPESFSRQLFSRPMSTRITTQPSLIAQTANTRRTIAITRSHRFLSTKSTIDPASPTASSTFADASTALPEPSDANAWDSNYNALLSPEQDVTPHIGYLYELGLDYGWGPTSFMQYIVEHVHVWSGMPWYGTLIASTIIVRMGLLPIFIRGADHSGKMISAGTILAPLQRKVAAAKASGDSAEMMKYMQEGMAIRRALKINTLAMFLPMALQVPLAFGAYRLARGMADLPVPGFTTGGFLWFQDLTIADPYMILPAATSMIMYFALKRGTEMGTAATLQQAHALSYVRWILPPLSLVFTMWLPAALTLQFITASIIAYVQTRALASNSFRRFVNIHPVPVQTATASRESIEKIKKFTTVDTTINQAPPPSSTLGKPLEQVRGKYKQAKDWVADTKKAAEDSMTKKEKPGNARLSKTEKQKAENYERRRRAEIEEEKFRKRQDLLRKKDGE